MASSFPADGQARPRRGAWKQAGAAAIVLPSLFEEEIDQEDSGPVYALEHGSEGFAEALDYFPDSRQLPNTARGYLELLEAKKSRRCPSSPA